MSADTKSSIMAFLAGFAGRNPANLNMLRTYPHWRRMAMHELDRRAVRFLEILPEQELHEIATGQVDMAELVGALLDRP